MEHQPQFDEIKADIKELFIHVGRRVPWPVFWIMVGAAVTALSFLLVQYLDTRDTVTRHDAMVLALGDNTKALNASFAGFLANPDPGLPVVTAKLEAIQAFVESGKIERKTWEAEVRAEFKAIRLRLDELAGKTHAALPALPK